MKGKKLINDIKEVVEEYDTSKEIWDMYKTIYKWNESNKYWDLESKPTDKKKPRRFAKIKLAGLKKYGFDNLTLLFGNTQKDNIRLSGDIVFNFSEGHYSKQANKYKKLLEKIADKDKKTSYQKKLGICIKNHHSSKNCALLLSNGKLQIAKKSIGDDRGDTFIWALNSYFVGESEIILNAATPEWVSVLRCFLDFFKHPLCPSESIYNYCEYFYNITDRELIDHLVNSGAKAIDTPERVCEYIDLAIEFWKERDKFFRQCGYVPTNI